MLNARLEAALTVSSLLFFLTFAFWLRLAVALLSRHPHTTTGHHSRSRIAPAPPRVRSATLRRPLLTVNSTSRRSKAVIRDASHLSKRSTHYLYHARMLQHERCAELTPLQASHPYSSPPTLRQRFAHPTRSSPSPRQHPSRLRIRDFRLSPLTPPQARAVLAEGAPIAVFSDAASSQQRLAAALRASPPRLRHERAASRGHVFSVPLFLTEAALVTPVDHRDISPSCSTGDSLEADTQQHPHQAYAAGPPSPEAAQSAALASSSCLQCSLDRAQLAVTNPSDTESAFAIAAPTESCPLCCLETNNDRRLEPGPLQAPETNTREEIAPIAINLDGHSLGGLASNEAPHEVDGLDCVPLASPTSNDQFQIPGRSVSFSEVAHNDARLLRSRPVSPGRAPSPAPSVLLSWPQRKSPSATWRRRLGLESTSRSSIFPCKSRTEKAEDLQHGIQRPGQKSSVRPERAFEKSTPAVTETASWQHSHKARRGGAQALPPLQANDAPPLLRTFAEPDDTGLPEPAGRTHVNQPDFPEDTFPRRSPLRSKVAATGVSTALRAPRPPLLSRGHYAPASYGDITGASEREGLLRNGMHANPTVDDYVLPASPAYSARAAPRFQWVPSLPSPCMPLWGRIRAATNQLEETAGNLRRSFNLALLSNRKGSGAAASSHDRGPRSLDARRPPRGGAVAATRGSQANIANTAPVPPVASLNERDRTADWVSRQRLRQDSSEDDMRPLAPNQRYEDEGPEFTTSLQPIPSRSYEFSSDDSSFLAPSARWAGATSSRAAGVQASVPLRPYTAPTGRVLSCPPGETALSWPTQALSWPCPDGGAFRPVPPPRTTSIPTLGGTSSATLDVDVDLDVDATACNDHALEEGAPYFGRPFLCLDDTRSTATSSSEWESVWLSESGEAGGDDDDEEARGHGPLREFASLSSGHGSAYTSYYSEWLAAIRLLETGHA